MKITKRHLRRIIREAITGGPRMSGMMNPEPQEVMDDIERRKNMGLEEKVKEWYGQEIGDLAMIIHYERPESKEEAFDILGADPNVYLSEAEPAELDIIWRIALEQAEDI